MKGFEDIGEMNLADLDRPEGALGNDDEYDGLDDYGDIDDDENNDDYENDEDDEDMEDLNDEDAGQEESSAEPEEEEGETASTVDAEIVTVGDLESGEVEEYDDIVKPVPDEPEELRELPLPQGEHYYIEARITQSEMNAFMFGHSYRSPLLIIIDIIAIIWPISVVVTHSSSLYLAIIIAIIILVGIPISTWNRGRSTIRQNPIYNDIFHFMFDEWGLHLKISDRLVEVEWRNVTKYMFLKSLTAVYTGRSNAFLLPTKDMGDQEEEIKAFLLKHKGGR